MDRFVIRQNIERYAALLQRERDEQRRQKLERLLAEEQMKLVRIDKPVDGASDKNSG